MITDNSFIAFIKFNINAIFSKKSTRLRAGKKGKEKK